MEYPYVNTLWTNETKCRSSQWAKFSKTVSSFNFASEASKNVAEKLFDCRKNCEYDIFLLVNI